MGALIYQARRRRLARCLPGHVRLPTCPRLLARHPAALLTWQVAKYVALCSSKGYAIGQKFLEWIEARLADLQDQQEAMDELLGNPEDVLAICGSRM